MGHWVKINHFLTVKTEKPIIEKIFKVETEDNESKKNKTEKKIKTASNSKIKYSFSRRGR